MKGAKMLIKFNPEKHSITGIAQDIIDGKLLPIPSAYLQTQTYLNIYLVGKSVSEGAPLAIVASKFHGPGIHENVQQYKNFILVNKNEMLEICRCIMAIEEKEYKRLQDENK
jgi:hypothetical protein